MKKFSKLGTAMVLSLTLAMVTPSVLPFADNIAIVEAATIKLNQKTAVLTKGKTLQLKLTGTKSKVNWTSSQKTIAAVDQKGKVTAKKPGKTTITATVNKKKYTCVVTVKSASSANTPFKSKTVEFENFEFVMPASWTTMTDKDVPLISFYPSKEDPTTATTYINTIIAPSSAALDYDLLKETYVNALKRDFSQLGLELAEEGIKVTELKNQSGTALKAEYSMEMEGVNYSCVCYILSTDEYIVQIMGTDSLKDANPSAASASEQMYKLLKKIK